MIQPRALASFTECATLTRVVKVAPTSQIRQAATVRQIRRTPLVAARKESFTRINTLPVVTPAKTAIAVPVITWPVITQSGQARQVNIVAASRATLNLKASAVLRQILEPFSYIRVIPPTPPLPPSIDGGGFDDSHSRVLDGGQFGEENQPITDGGSW